jgi:hypothetical protein
MDPATDWVVSGGRGALDFDGTDDIVTATALRPSFPMSVSWWAKYNSVTNQNAVVQFATASGIDYVFHVYNSTDSRTYFFTDSVNVGNNVSILTTLRPSIADWVQVGIVFSSSTSVAVYWNGSLLTATSVTGVGSITPAGLQFGRRTGAATGSVDGALDDIAIFNTALTAIEVREIYRLGRGYGIGASPHRSRRAAAGFKAYWANRRSQLIGGGV